MLDNSKPNHTVTVVIIGLVVVAMATMYFGLASKSEEEGCMTIGEELLDKGGRNRMSDAKYQEYAKRIKKACSKKIAQDFLSKAER